MGQFQIVDFDGAETLVDFGSGAPGGAFCEDRGHLRSRGQIGEAWAPTGMSRWESVRTLRQMPQWVLILQ